MIHAKENRPGGASGATSRSTSHSATADALESTLKAPRLSPAEIAESRPLYLVVIKTVTDRRVRRTFLSLAAAEKAARRAQARGQAVTLELHRLVPYTVGAELHSLEDGGAR